VSPLARAVIGAEISVSRQRLASYIQLGEKAQSTRNAAGLAQVASLVLDLPLDSITACVGSYYFALALNRGGVHCFPDANKILLEVADRGPGVFKSKAMLAFGTNCSISGDWPAAAAAYAEVASMSQGYGISRLHTMCCVDLQLAWKREHEGDPKWAIEILGRLYPKIHSLGREYLPLVHMYYNNLAAVLAKTGLIEQAKSFSKIIEASPFLGAYPEWQKTCADLDTPPQQKASSQLFAIGKSYGGSLSASNVVSLPGVPDSPPPLRDTATVSPFHRPAKVLSLEAWKKKKAASSQPKVKLTAAEIPHLTTQQKQAAILRFILSDGVTDQSLDRVLHSMIGEPLPREDEPGA
jgi:hypothetical protein